MAVWPSPRTGRIMASLADPKAATTYGNPTAVSVPPSHGSPSKVMVIFTVNNTLVMVSESLDGTAWSTPRDITLLVKGKGW